MRPSVVFFIAVCGFLVFGTAEADDSVRYVTSSALKLRGEPSPDGKIIGVVPIGHAVYCRPNCASDNGWYAVNSYQSGEDDIGAGYVFAELVSATKPDFDQILEQYNKVPKESVTERLKYAERLLALSPGDVRAQQSILWCMQQLGDQQALKETEDKIAKYNNPQPKRLPGEPRIVASYNGLNASLIAVMNDEGELTPAKDIPVQDIKSIFGYERFNYLHSRGQKTGYVMVNGLIEGCYFSKCPYDRWDTHLAFMKFFPEKAGEDDVDKRVTGLLTNFPLRESTSELKISGKQKKQLIELAVECIQSAKCNHDLKSNVPDKFISGIKANDEEFVRSIVAVPGNDPSNPILVGAWTLGNLNDSHYQDAEFISAFMIAEKSSTGKYEISLSDVGGSDCEVYDYADLDGDGLDEIVLLCDGVEGYSETAVLKKQKSGWRLYKNDTPIWFNEMYEQP